MHEYMLRSSIRNASSGTGRLVALLAMAMLMCGEPAFAQTAVAIGTAKDPNLAGFIKSFPISIVSPYLAHAGWGGKLDSEGVPLFQQAMVGKISAKECLDKFAEVLTKNMS